MKRNPSIGVGITVVASLAALALLGAPPHASAQGQNPFVDRSDTGETVHVLPTPASIRSPHDTGPTMAPSGNGTTVYPASYGSGSLVNHHGPVMSDAGFQALYWNADAANARPSGNNNPTLLSQIDAFIWSFGHGALAEKPYSQASTDDFSIVQQYSQPNNAISSRVLNYGYRVASAATKSSISDSGIRSFIAAQFQSGLAWNSSTIYGVYLPPGMKVTMSGSSCSTFCGYHGHFTYNGFDIRYAVFPYLNCNACKLSNLTVADMMTIVASHEIREAVTDPQLNAWYDNSGYEADDKCAWHNLYRTTDGFAVQPEYSNGDGSTYPGPGCVVPDQP
jgi:hypothetical protein